MNTTESIGNFAFLEAGLNGLDPAERAGLRRYLAQRERTINRVEMLSLRCAGGPLSGQQITLEDTKDSSRSAEFCLRGMRGYYRANGDCSGAEWVSSEPAQPLKWDIDSIPKIQSEAPQDLQAKAKPCETSAPAPKRSTDKPLPKTHSQLATFVARLQTGQADKFTDAIGNTIEADAATAESFAIFRLHRLMYKLKNTPDRMTALAAQLIRIRRHLSDKLLPPAPEFCRQPNTPQDLGEKATPCETSKDSQSNKPAAGNIAILEKEQPVAGIETAQIATKMIVNNENYLTKLASSYKFSACKPTEYAAALREAAQHAQNMTAPVALIFDGKEIKIMAAGHLAEDCCFTQLFAYGAKTLQVLKIVFPTNQAKGQPPQEIAMQTTQKIEPIKPVAVIECAQSAPKIEAPQDLKPCETSAPAPKRSTDKPLPKTHSQLRELLNKLSTGEENMINSKRQDYNHATQKMNNLLGDFEIYCIRRAKYTIRASQDARDSVAAKLLKIKNYMTDDLLHAPYVAPKKEVSSPAESAPDAINLDCATISQTCPENRPESTTASEERHETLKSEKIMWRGNLVPLENLIMLRSQTASSMHKYQKNEKQKQKAFVAEIDLALVGYNKWAKSAIDRPELKRHSCNH
jgi:hypothetical protein